DECDCGCHDHEHHHHHDHDDECDCGCHGHHHADEVFTSCGIETSRRYTVEEIDSILAFFDEGVCGVVLRAKGIVAGADGKWIHFDYVPGERNIRYGSADITGRICVIGAGLEKSSVREIFMA
ncbi:MAG: GTP-binding protein, partial [Clostridia bacterium]|nr:GTP-binding protein [Clostridia bacterium]